jgi:hypothetical protein
MDKENLQNYCAGKDLAALQLLSGLMGGVHVAQCCKTGGNRFRPFGM